MNNWKDILDQTEQGKLRAAFKDSTDKQWKVNPEVKLAILEAFKMGELAPFENYYTDNKNLFPQTFSMDRKVRMVPRGSSVRRGTYIAPGVIIMPPTFVNIGCYIGSGTMLDSHSLVGSCAQIGKNVHLSASAQIGGVLEPIGQTPVIIEDNVFIGAGAIIVEEVQIQEAAVIAPGVVLSKGIPVYDSPNKRLLAKGEPIPQRAVVISGSRPIGNNRPWALEQGLSMNCAIIIKYRDQHSNAHLELEDCLR